MARQNSYGAISTRRPLTRKVQWIDGFLHDVTPLPGHTYTRETWPPRGRGRGESLTSPRRIEAKFRAAKALDLYQLGHTWASIATATGYQDASGAWRAVRRLVDRSDWNTARREELKKERSRC